MIKSPATPRLRIFAGPNGSGKSTIINSVSAYEVKGKPLDLGVYINATRHVFTFILSQFVFK